MTRLQQEVSRKLQSIGCSSEYDNESEKLNITLGNQSICRLDSGGNYTYRAGEHISKDHEEAFFKVEKTINQAKEYISAYNNASQFEIEGITDYRKLAEYDDVVFGAKDMGEQHGFQFSSWFKTYGGTGATMGDYSFDYEYSKQSFAERSGLIDKNRQFNNDQLENIFRCVAFTKQMNDGLTFDQEKELDGLMDRIGAVLPYVLSDPQFDLFDYGDGGMTMQ